MQKTAMSWHRGGCHCGAVTFEVQTPDAVELIDCNCSICSATGYLHLIVPASRFRLLTGADKLTTYSFGNQIAKHRFCKICGIKSFYVPRSHPTGYSVNFRCLSAGEFAEVMTTQFDGKFWDENAASLPALEN